MSNAMNLFHISQDGTYQKLGTLVDIKEVSAPDTDEEFPKISMINDERFTLTINLKRQSKKAWGRMFQMQRYEVTELMFPQKKKRGTARRIRRRKNNDRHRTRATPIPNS